jgi:hypothetical protein
MISCIEIDLFLYRKKPQSQVCGDRGAHSARWPVGRWAFWVAGDASRSADYARHLRHRRAAGPPRPGAAPLQFALLRTARLWCERHPPHPRPDSRRVPMREPRSMRGRVLRTSVRPPVYRAILVEGEPPGERAGEPESP